VAALLVDPEQQVVRIGPERPAERSQPLERRHVVGEEHDAAPAAREEAPDPVRRLDAREAREDARRGEPLELTAHPRTAPDVRPKAIRRCTSRKKTTTGIAVSVDAA